MNEHLTPAQRAQPCFYTFLPRMFVSLFLEERFATTATFDDECIVDSSHLLLPTWPCPRSLFQFTVNSIKLRFYTENNVNNPRKQCQLEDIKNQSSIRRNYSPRSLASVLEFRYQSLTLQYIEIGLFDTFVFLAKFVT